MYRRRSYGYGRRRSYGRRGYGGYGRRRPYRSRSRYGYRPARRRYSYAGRRF